ncbi:eat-18 [Cordylochernes scorpioides]|uniref:Eat-18 n=1 Tax=Cordylochernes scorpioides TaxID=51811 RepID=A0ABY6K4W9_9ARAC|nr:eat-18 [Cordylochernes scorpioides]
MSLPTNRVDAPSCPFDYVKVFDGPSMDDPLIGVYCGQQRNLVVYSSTHNLFVYFSTLPRMAYASNRGFAAWYEFSERFVSLSEYNGVEYLSWRFIQVNESEHIRGTECDQKILSRKESSGYVCSPNFPFPFHPNVVCRYYIYGMQDSQDLERVRLKFESFEVSRAEPDVKVISLRAIPTSRCPDGHVKLYLQGQEERAAIEEFDHVFCGDTPPLPVLSEGPRLVMVFNSGSAQGLGFKAKYTFETERLTQVWAADYKVPGTASPNGSCIFQYSSESRKTGDFNSPRHPANYPSATRCEYYFFARSDEQIKFVFNYFKTKTDIAVAGYNEVCVEDWLEILEVFPNRRERKIGRYCGKTAPGPVVSDTGVHTMKAVLHTDSGGVASGFLASYTFLNLSSVTDCGRNISDEESGVITSPGFPGPYQPFRQLCNWYISVKPNYKVLLSFDFFLIEGSPTGACFMFLSAVLIMFKIGISISKTRLPRRRGQDLEGPEPGSHRAVRRAAVQRHAGDCIDIVSPQTHRTRLWALLASSARGLRFNNPTVSIDEQRSLRLIQGDVPEPCEGYICPVSHYCISQNLRCNGESNCGLDDKSDEEHCTPYSITLIDLNLYLVAGLTAGGSTLFLLICCFCCHRKRKRRRHRRRQLPPPYDRYRPREVPGLQFVSDNL